MSRLAKTVGIIGAGISGLRCADVLLSRGFQVTILEARNRIGGRICQSHELGFPLDLGPNWIHGDADDGSASAHALSRLATLTNTPVQRGNIKTLTFEGSSGQLLDQSTSDRLQAVMWGILTEAFEFSKNAHLGPDAGKIPIQDTLQDYVNKRAAEVMPDDRDRRIILQMAEVFGTYLGESIAKQSLAHFWMESCCFEDGGFVETSYAAILDRIAQPVRDGGAWVLLDTYVTHITTDPTPKLTTSSGDTHLFDAIVCTAPLGWLKRNLATFSPPLPAPITSAIQAVSLAQLEKVYLAFPEPFWRHANQTTNASLCMSWLQPDYANATNPAHWPFEAFDLSKLTPPNNRAVLLFYIYGDCSRHVVSQMQQARQQYPAPAAFAAERTRVLTALLQPYYSRIPAYQAENPAHQPCGAVATEWFADDLAGNASYCMYQPGVSGLHDSIQTITRGWPERRLWFSGEHAAPSDESGTATGAYLSGQLVGERVAEALEGGKL